VFGEKNAYIKGGQPPRTGKKGSVQNVKRFEAKGEDLGLMLDLPGKGGIRVRCAGGALGLNLRGD